MTKLQRKLFTERVEKLFKVMESMYCDHEWLNQLMVVDNVKQLYSSFIIHKMIFIRVVESNDFHIRHDVREVRNHIDRNVLFEGYKFHPKRKNKFELTSIGSSKVHVRLFDRWSKIDVDDLLMKIDLKIVELI